MLISHVDRAEEMQLFELDVRFEVCVVLVHRVCSATRPWIGASRGIPVPDRDQFFNGNTL